MAATPTNTIIKGRSRETTRTGIGVEIAPCVCKIVGQSDEWRNRVMTDLKWRVGQAFAKCASRFDLRSYHETAGAAMVFDLKRSNPSSTRGSARGMRNWTSR